MSTTLKTVAEKILRVRLLLVDAGEAQWQLGRTPTPREDTTERSKGMVSDPTPSVVADERRLQLRVAVLKAEAALERADTALATAEAELSAALTEWQG